MYYLRLDCPYYLPPSGLSTACTTSRPKRSRRLHGLPTGRGRGEGRGSDRRGGRNRRPNRDRGRCASPT